MDGVWTIEDNGTTTAKEIFNNGELLEGTSFTIMLDNQKYYSNPNSTIYGINHLQYVKILSPAFCNNAPVKLSIFKTFQDDLFSLLSPKASEFKNSWFFVEIQTDKNGDFSNAIEFPKNKELNSLITEKLKFNKIDIGKFRTGERNQLILLFFDAEKLYFGSSTEINNFILNWRY